MLTVEQVKNLDGKVRKALDLIESLKSENSMLKAKLDEYKQRVDQLESVVDGFKLEQLEIEEGIKDVLTQLDELEDQITDPSPSAPVIPTVEPVTEEPIAVSPVIEQQSVSEELNEETSVSDDLTEETLVSEELNEEPSVSDDLIEETSVSEELTEETLVSEESSDQTPELEIF